MERRYKSRSGRADQDLIQEVSELLKQSGIFFSDTQLKQLWLYHTLLRLHNPRLNLTRIHSFTNMVLKLYVDSILPGMLMELPCPLLDLGTGPGMPGIPLKIAFPHLEVILSEGRQKRVAFLEMVINELKLEDISVIGKSITPRFQIPVSGVITRAVEGIEKTLERVQGCLKANGLVLFMKGPHCDEEIQAAIPRVEEKFKLVRDQPYQIPGTPHKRRLVVFQRTDRPFTEQKALAMKKHPFHTIESEQNAVFKDLKKLLTARGIKKQQLALVSGEKMVSDALTCIPQRCSAWITRLDQTPPGHAPDHMVWYSLSHSLFQELDVFGTGTPLLRVKIEPILPWHPRDGFPKGLSLLVPFQDPENVGAVIRSAVAFGVGQVILLAESAHPYHPKAIRASGGAVLHAPLYRGPSIKDLPMDIPILALSPEGTDISHYQFPDSFGLLTGMEGTGLPNSFRQGSYSIPIYHEVDSLNAAAATAVVLYLWSQAMKKR